MIVEIDTEIWEDSWFDDLKPLAKLVFLYLNTNSNKNTTGLYKVRLKSISNGTGIPKDEVEKIIREELYTEKHGVKVLYDFEKEIVFILNHTRKQFMRTGKISPKIIQNIAKNLNSIHEHPFILVYLEKYKEIVQKFTELDIPYTYPIHTLSMEGYSYLSSEGVRCIGEGEKFYNSFYNKDDDSKTGSFEEYKGQGLDPFTIGLTYNQLTKDSNLFPFRFVDEELKKACKGFNGNLTDFEEIVKKACTIPFLQGDKKSKDGRTFKADICFCITRANKVLNGFYEQEEMSIETVDKETRLNIMKKNIAKGGQDGNHERKAK